MRKLIMLLIIGVSGCAGPTPMRQAIDYCAIYDEHGMPAAYSTCVTEMLPRYELAQQTAATSGGEGAEQGFNALAAIAAGYGQARASSDAAMLQTLQQHPLPAQQHTTCRQTVAAVHVGLVNMPATVECTTTNY